MGKYNYYIIGLILLLSCLISVSYAGAGDPNQNGLPNTCERQLHVLFNAYRVDPIFWSKNYFSGLIIQSSSKYKPVTPIPFIDGFVQSADDHAHQMATVEWSPLNCTDVLPSACANNASDPNPICQPPNVCCLRDADCSNVSLTSECRLRYYGWHVIKPYAAGGAVARGATDALTALRSILCDNIDGSIVPECCLPDVDTNVRQELLGSGYKIYNGGFGYATGDSLVKQPPYWAITFATNSQFGPPTWTSYIVAGVYSPWIFNGSTGSGGFLVTYSSGSSTAGPASNQIFVVISASPDPYVLQMVKINNNAQVWLYNGTAGGVDYSDFAAVTGGSCTTYYFMYLQQGSSTVMRYPQEGNLLIGASNPADQGYLLDTEPCGTCSPGTCLQGNCVCIAGKNQNGLCSTDSPASTFVLSFVILLISACIVLL